MSINLVLFKKNGSQRAFPLRSGVTLIGRRRSCDLQIPVMSVSRKHCEINRKNKVVKICDLSSHNGTSLNGKPIDKAVIQAGDYIKIGPLTFLLQIDGKPANPSLPINQSNLRKRLRKSELVDSETNISEEELFGSLPDGDEAEN